MRVCNVAIILTKYGAVMRPIYGRTIDNFIAAINMMYVLTYCIDLSILCNNAKGAKQYSKRTPLINLIFQVYLCSIVIIITTSKHCTKAFLSLARPYVINIVAFTSVSAWN